MNMKLSGDDMTDKFMTIKEPVAVFKYSGSKILFEKGNRQYIKAFGESDDILSLLSKNGKQSFCKAFKETVATGQETVCDCLCALGLGNHKWYHITFNLLDSNTEFSLVSAIFGDTTAENLEKNDFSDVMSEIKVPDKKMLKILIVDNSLRDIDVLTNMFSNEYEVLDATNGLEALEILKANLYSIALILMNTNLPSMNGEEFLAQKNLIPEAADISVIVISSDATSTMQKKMLKAGAADYITKPYVEETVIRRVKNVLEYNGRMRKVIKEYNDAILLENSSKNLMLNGVYTPFDLYSIIAFLKSIFSFVNIIEPIDMSLLYFKADGKVEKQPYSCNKIWDREKRCDTCTGLCSEHSQQLFSKFERVDNDIYYVISQPIRVALSEHKTVECILELATDLSSNIMMKEINGNKAEKILHETRYRIYNDSLTNVYNTRYYNEMLFVKQKEDGLPVRIGMIFFNICEYNNINKSFGNEVWNKILIDVAEILKEHSRKKDSVIRYSKLKFIVVLNNCEQSRMYQIAERLSKDLSSIRYGNNNENNLKINYGCAFTEDFQMNRNFLQKMTKLAESECESKVLDLTEKH